jgi:hypothetical protein
MRKSNRIKVLILPQGIGQFFNSKYTIKDVKNSFDYVSALDQINKQPNRKNVVIRVKRDKAVLVSELLQRKGFEVWIKNMNA